MEEVERKSFEKRNGRKGKGIGGQKWLPKGSVFMGEAIPGQASIFRERIRVSFIVTVPWSILQRRLKAS